MASLESFGYTLNKLKVDVRGCCTCENVEEGASLLVLPLKNCWTAQAVDKECPAVAQALQKAFVRHPEGLELQAACTKIALHLIFEHRQLQRNPEATPAAAQELRRKHLELLGPRSRKIETVLAWGRRDLESLQGSFWFEEAHRRQEEILADLQALLADLGPEVSLALGLIDQLEDGRSALEGELPRGSVEVYAWARWILQELSVQFLLPGGDRLDVLAPGLELVPKDASGGNGLLRLEKVEGSPALVLSASKALKAGEAVRLWHKGFACSQGFRLLMGVDGLKAAGPSDDISNPWESVEVLLRLPVSAKNTSENAQLWGMIEALEMALQASRPWLPNEELMLGDALPPDYGWRRVEVLQKESAPETAPETEDEMLEVQVRMPFSASTLPTSDALHQLGLLICADVDRMQKIMKEEKGILDPLGPEACCRRALGYLAKTLQWTLEEYPSHASTDARQLSRSAPKDVTGGLSRRVRGLLLVAAERELLVKALALIQQALEAEETPRPKTETSEAKEDLVYSLDWDEGEDQGPKDPSLPAAQFSGQATGTIKSRSKPEGIASTGATWEDLALEPLLGFSLPVLCDVLWRVEPMLPPVYSQGVRPVKPGYVEDSTTGTIFPPAPKFYDRQPSPQQRRVQQLSDSLVAKESQLQKADTSALPSSAASLRWALLELPGGATPNFEVINALVSMGCEDRLMYLNKQLVVQQKYLSRLSSGQHPGTMGSAKAKTGAYDVLVIPLEGWLNSSRLEQLCVDLVLAVQALVTEMGASVLRVILLSSLSIGPGSSTYRRDAVHRSAAALGVVRSARAELPQVPMLWLDTDAEDGKTFQEQMMSEVDLALPPGGHANPSSLERAQCLMAHNRDVAYRQGRRWLPRLDLSPNMPIYSGRVVPTLPPHVTGTGVALITGGVGGLGLAAAEALVELGMKRLVLSSKNGNLPDEQGVAQRVQAMKSLGAQLWIEACDVAKESDVRELLERIQDRHGPLRMVIHASGVLEDRPFMEQDAESFRKVFEPKASGAWYLHRHTLDDKLQNFLLFSSVAASRGSSTQANYAAANAYLDELARLRAAHGLPAVSIQWPAVAPWLEEPEEPPSVAICNGMPTGLEKKTSTSSISLAVVRQVVKLSVLNLKPIEPVQAVLPGAYLSSTSPTVRSLLHPLLARSNKRQESSMSLSVDKGSGLPISGTKLCLQLT